MEDGVLGGRLRAAVGVREDSVVRLEFGGHGEHLLDLADVAFVCLEALPRVEVPQTDGAVVGGGEEGARCRVDFDCVDPVGVAAEEEAGFVLKVPDADGFVHGAGGKEFAVKVEANHAGGVAGKRADAFACSPVPHFEGVVNAATDEFGIVKLQTSDSTSVAGDSTSVAGQCTHFFAGFNVPNLDIGIVRSSRKNAVIELQTHDSVGVALENSCRAASILPVGTNFESILVYIFPRTYSRFERCLILVFFDRFRASLFHR